MWTTNVSAYFDPLYDFRLVNIMIPSSLETNSDDFFPFLETGWFF